MPNAANYNSKRVIIYVVNGDYSLGLNNPDAQVQIIDMAPKGKPPKQGWCDCQLGQGKLHKHVFGKL